MIILSLGSNLGDREANICQALQLLSARQIRIIKQSSIYETEPVGYTDQPFFLNMAVLIETRLTPQELLAVCLDVEAELGRVRALRWGPRIIDIDIITYNDIKLDLPQLTLPHPRLGEREFVLVPIQEIAPDLPLLHGKTASQLLAALPNHRLVKLYRRAGCGNKI